MEKSDLFAVSVLRQSRITIARPALAGRPNCTTCPFWVGNNRRGLTIEASNEQLAVACSGFKQSPNAAVMYTSTTDISDKMGARAAALTSCGVNPRQVYDFPGLRVPVTPWRG